ncbi:unnamed protein product [Aureobasidium mustum]|uniref:Uncharacterized protein n=1 Tax=Aureobasidium mustum TaxID=2773714 RepID=A0A9N8K739_9PEZI|nr:unnamed protein product [Aureobasidium mustum]
MVEIEFDQPPAYPTHVAIPPSSEATTAPAYTSIHEDPLQPSRDLPPSRPLQRLDRLELTNQSTTINIGQAHEALTDNSTTEPTKSKNKDDTCCACAALCFFLAIVALLVTMIYCATSLKRDVAAFKENSKVLEEVKHEMQHMKETVTATVTAIIHETERISKRGHVDKITETVTQTVDGHVPTGSAWVTKIGNARRW